MYIYIDMLFFLNLSMNMIILMLTAQAAGVAWRWHRITLAAAAGSLYAVGAVLPELALLYSLPVKLLISVALVLCAFPCNTLRTFLLAFSLFYVVSFIVGGAVVGWLFFSETSYFLTPGAGWTVSWTNLLCGSVIAALFLMLIARSVLSKLNRRGGLYKVKVRYRGRSNEFMAILDTGNRLISPFTHRPVVLVEKEVLEPVFSELSNKFLNAIPAQFWLGELEKCEDTEWLARIEPIPFQGVGSRSMLLGFRPDAVEVSTQSGVLENTNVVIGVYGAQLAPDNAYRALLHPFVLEGHSVTRRRENANKLVNHQTDNQA
jgi:stage II sporulation protein GA (sporulation sigma-E factor processing peptidase)